MNTIAFQSMARKTLSVVLSFALLNFPISAKDQGLSGVDVKLDQLSFEKVMDVKIGVMASGLSPEENNYFCKLAALAVAQAAGGKEDYRAAAKDLLDQTVKGVEIGA